MGVALSSNSKGLNSGWFGHVADKRGGSCSLPCLSLCAVSFSCLSPWRSEDDCLQVSIATGGSFSGANRLVSPPAPDNSATEERVVLELVVLLAERHDSCSINSASLLQESISPCSDFKRAPGSTELLPAGHGSSPSLGLPTRPLPASDTPHTVQLSSGKAEKPVLTYSVRSRKDSSSPTGQNSGSYSARICCTSRLTCWYLV